MTVSLVIIAYNEANSLPNLLEDIKKQDYPHNKMEVVLVDGVSEDTTKEIMQNFALQDNGFFSVKVLDNQRRIQSCGWNIGIIQSKGDAILRIDAHARIPEDFITKNIEVLAKGENISSGKVENFATEHSSWGDIVNAAESSMFGGSFAKFRRAETAGYVDTAAFAVYKKEIFDKVGLFNENLKRTEDNELHYRMRKAGYKFYYTPEIQSSRETRNSFGKLIKQKYGNGYWIGLTMGVCPQCFSLYHFIPFLFVLGILTTTLLACFGIWQIAAVMWVLYGLFAVLNTILSSIGKPFNAYYLLMPFMFLILHIGYGVGTLVGVVKMPFWKRKIQ